jgi:type IV secretory pathway VirB9-like protein
MMLPALLAFAVLAGEPSTKARTIVYHDSDIAQLYVQIGSITEVHLPDHETIIEARCANRDFFRVNWNEPGTILFIQPQDLVDGHEGGKRTNLIAVMASGNTLSFIVQEVSRIKDAHADLKVKVQESDESNIVAAQGAPKFVPAADLDKAKQQAAQAQTELEKERAAHAQVAQMAATKEAGTISLDYELYDKKGKGDLRPQIYRDDKFTYIRIDTEELPSIWELKDSKLSKLDPTFRDGRYVITKHVDDGELRVGKSSIKFRFKGV